MNTRTQTKKANTQNLQNIQNTEQRRLSSDKSKNINMNELLLEKIENLSINMTNLSKDLNKELNSFKREIKQEIREDLKEITQTVEKLTQETQRVKQKVDILEIKNEKVENELIKILAKEERELDEKAIAELKAKEKSVRIRGIPEDKDLDLYGKLTEEIALFLKRDPASFEFEIDKLYRVNSLIAKQKGLPRDVLVFFVRKSVRDAFLNVHNDTPFCFGNQELRILKEIPGRILRKRREYSTLTTFLRDVKITYRWELPEGLTFWWKKKRVRILTPEQAKKFLKQVKTQYPTKQGEDRDSEQRNQLDEEEEEGELLNLQDPPIPDLEYDEQELLQEEIRIRREEKEREEKY